MTHLVLIDGKVFRVAVHEILTEGKDGFSGVVFRAENAKLFRLAYNRFSFWIPARDKQNKQ